MGNLKFPRLPPSVLQQRQSDSGLQRALDAIVSPINTVLQALSSVFSLTSNPGYLAATVDYLTANAGANVFPNVTNFKTSTAAGFNTIYGFAAGGLTLTLPAVAGQAYGKWVTATVNASGTSKIVTSSPTTVLIYGPAVVTSGATTSAVFSTQLGASITMIHSSIAGADCWIVTAVTGTWTYT